MKTCALLLAAASTAAAQAPGALRDAIAPGGTLRAAFLGGNPVQGVVNPQTQEVTGPVAEIVRELARRMGAPFAILPVQGVPAVMDAVRTGAADIGFLAYDATRAEQVAFTQPYILGHNTYMVKADSPIRTFADADRAGMRIGAGAGDAVDLFLSRTLKQARLVHPREATLDEIVRMLAAGEADAYAANQQRLTEAAARAPGFRILDGSVLPVQQSIVARKENAAAIAALNRFIDQIRDSGFLQAVVARARIAGVEVAPRGFR